MEVDNLVLIRVKDLNLSYDGMKIKSLLSPPERIRFDALSIDSLHVGDGEIIAIMGHNGAGKSTMLSALAGKMRPSSGEIEVIGTVIHLSGVNPGFDPIFSPRQNLKWLSRIYGCDSSSIIAEVEEFAEIGEAFDRPIRTLSGGMKGRVGFGFATSLNPDILLIDEVLGVGDPSFKAKATSRLKGMMKNTGIVLMSTHSVGLVKELASRTVIVEKGRIIHDGEVTVGLNLYSEIK